ncbi:MAG: hypothetical protein IKU23_07975 [Clostridia bacterium]|nr:hypothetical protein [Clostridia bacterium]MBR5279180.1 hypothetical protein [Clostridia bacterium]
MKKLLLLITALIMVLSLCSCGDGEKLAEKDGMYIAGKDGGNEAVQYSFLYPKEWELSRNDGTIDLTYDCNAGSSKIDMATISVYAFGLEKNMTALEYWDTYKTDLEEFYVVKQSDGSFKSTFKQLDMDFYGETATADDVELPKLDDSPAIKVKYSGEKNNRVYVSDQIICCRYKTVYFITLTVPEAYYDDVAPALMAIKDNFIFQD